MKRRLQVVRLALFSIAAVCLFACCQRTAAADREPAPPQFSHETGVYDKAFKLTVTSDADTTVRYTLDGSLPTGESPVFPAEGMTIADRSHERNVLAAVATKYRWRPTLFRLRSPRGR